MATVLDSTDQYGTYHVGDRSFFSKLEAIMHSRSCGKPIEWKYQHAEFSKHNWTQEPSESLWELYTQRAYQLREKYDYLILLYSGGADSNNVLDVFERNNIPIDEIKMSYVGEISDLQTLDLPANREIYYSALPRAKELQKKWPKLKIDVINGQPAMIDSLSGDLDLLHFGKNMSFNLWQRTRVGITMEGNQEWLADVSMNKSIAIIYGKDKTQVSKINNRYAIQFSDSSINGNLETLPDNYHHEYFYWSSEHIKILIKQGHILKKFFREADTNPQWFTENAKYFCKDNSRQWLYAKIDIKNQSIALNNACYNTLMYPYYDKYVYDVGKLEWQTVSQIIQNTFYHDQNLKQRLNDYLKQLFHWYKDGYMLSNFDLQKGPIVYFDQPWFLEA